MDQGQQVVVGLDNGGTTNNATVLDATGKFLVDALVETPSRVREGPAVAVGALAESFEHILQVTGLDRSAVLGIGLDTPGPASAAGVISMRGAVNFLNPDWRGFDIRGAVEERIGLPVVYNNDANAASLYAHHRYSSVSLIVGTGLGGGVVEGGKVVRGAAGMAGELGHIRIPVDGLLDEGQPMPACNCGQPADAESFASLSGIAGNLLPYWLTRYPGHELSGTELRQAARLVRGYGEAGDPMAREIFRQQAIAIGRLFTIAANFTDPDIYFLGGGVVEAAPEFRDWYLGLVRENTDLRSEQAAVASFALVPDLDMAGARGSAIAANDLLRGGRLGITP
jgi:glucokinase